MAEAVDTVAADEAPKLVDICVFCLLIDFEDEGSHILFVEFGLFFLRLLILVGRVVFAESRQDIVYFDFIECLGVSEFADDDVEQIEYFIMFTGI